MQIQRRRPANDASSFGDACVFLFHSAKVSVMAASLSGGRETVFLAVSYRRPRATTEVEGGVIWPGVADNCNPNLSTNSIKVLNKKVA